MKEALMAASGVDAVTLDPWQEPGIPLAELGLKALTQDPSPDEWSLSDGAGLPSSQETSASRTSPGV
jgi:hypothetical protein